MKSLAPLLFLLCLGISSFGQVGINTTEPTTTLDINGTLRVRGYDADSEQVNRAIATKIIGVDSTGAFVEVIVDENLVLKDNRISATNRIVNIGDIEDFTIPILNDIRLLILPGEANEDRAVIRLSSILGNMIITGFEPGVDGQTVWLYPQSGDLTFLPNSILSLFGNQIESNNNMTVNQYNMVKLMYDATRSKWIIMDH